MKEENRINALKSVVMQLFKIATAINQEGSISLRFFGNDEISGLDNLKTIQEISQKLEEVKFETSLYAPKPLAGKIIDPLTAKAQDRQLNKPKMVIVITDGGVGYTYLY